MQPARTSVGLQIWDKKEHLPVELHFVNSTQIFRRTFCSASIQFLYYKTAVRIRFDYSSEFPQIIDLNSKV